MKECLGISGKLFGHKYKTVYETKSNPPSVEEANQAVKMLSSVLSPIRYVPHSNTILPSSISQRNEEIQTYNNRVQQILNGSGRENIKPLYEVCIRCGEKIIL